MTSLTDKMEGLRESKPRVQPPENEYYQASLAQFNRVAGVNATVDKCIALALAEEAVVGDWEVEFDNRFLVQSHIKDKAGNTSIH